MTRREEGASLVDTIIQQRGDVFEEVRLMAALTPVTVRLMMSCAGYVHSYQGHTREDQLLSGQMRELIALCQLAAMRDDGFAPNHVRRLYRLGVTDAIMLEAAQAIAAAVGHSTILHVCQAIGKALDPEYPYGELPDGGPPTEPMPFPEMSLWRIDEAPAWGGAAQSATWAEVARVDPVLAERFTAFLDHCAGLDTPVENYLSPGVRTLVTIPALAARGLTDSAAEHMRKARCYGVSLRHVLEAVSCVLPMTGSATMDVAVAALRLLNDEPWPAVD